MTTAARWGVGRWGATRWGAVSDGPAATTIRTGPRYTIRVRDSSLAWQAEVDDFLELTLTLRFNDVGTWRLIVPVDSAAVGYLTAGAGIIVQRNGDPIFSGPIAALERRWSKDEDVLDASGPDDTVWLARRVTSPDPSLSGPDGSHHYNTHGYDTRTGVAETIMRQYVNLNAGPGAVVARRVSGLTLAPDEARGTSVTGNERWGTLLDALRSLAQAGGGLGFRILQIGSALQFGVYAPADRTASAVFSKERGNLQTFRYRQAAPSGNYIYELGGGDLTARTIVEGSDSASVTAWGRIEATQDRRDTTDTAVLVQAATDTLAASAGSTSLSLTPIDTDSLAFWTDYTLGDQVTVVVDGTPVSDVLRELAITLQGTGTEVLAPTVGTPDAPQPGILGLFQRLAAIGRRVGRLETTQ